MTKLTTDQKKLVEGARKYAYTLVHRFLYRHPRFRHLHEELDQEAVLALVLSAPNYKPSPKAPAFARFCTMAVKRRVWRYALYNASAITGGYKVEGKARVANTVFVETEESLPEDTEELSSPDRLDACAVAIRVRPEMSKLLLDRWEKSGAGGTGYHKSTWPQRAERLVDLFLRMEFNRGYESASEIAKDYGMNGGNRASACARNMVPVFDTWAKSIREEA